MSSKQILVVEDEPSISDSLVGVLGKEGFNSTVAGTIIEARQALESNLFDAIILDVSLPDGNGFDFCKEIRQNSNIPILFLTAWDKEIDQVRGLEIGADDYVTKPFSPGLLTIKIKAILRRVKDIPPLLPETQIHINAEK